MDKIIDGSDRHSYYAEIPNIVFMLGLSPYELALYCHLKRTAGEHGGCWKKTETLAEETKMSAGMVSQAKEVLSQPRPELNGKALITIVKEKRKEGGKPNHIITITDIWPENMARFGAISPDEQANSYSEIATSPHEKAISPDEIKKNPSEEEPSEEIVNNNFLPEWLDAKLWARWVVHRSELRRPLTLQQSVAQIAQLEKFRARGMPPEQVINNSITNGWQGLFELKGFNNGKNGNRRESNRAGANGDSSVPPPEHQGTNKQWGAKNRV